MAKKDFPQTLPGARLGVPADSPVSVFQGADAEETCVGPTSLDGRSGGDARRFVDHYSPVIARRSPESVLLEG